MTEKSPSNGSDMPGAEPEHLGTVLVVDGDRVSGRFVELALSAKGLGVEVARDGAGAFEVLRTTKIDLILCETTLPDFTGLHFMRRLAEDSSYAHLPIIFLSAEARLDAKVAALNAGALDYLTKPIDKKELAARCLATVRRTASRRDAARKRPYSLAGDFSALPFADLVSMLAMGRGTGTLYVVAKNFSGHLAFEQGVLQHAQCGNLTGQAAFNQILAEPSGHFELDPTPPNLAPDQFSVSESLTQLLLEGARIQDEFAHSSGLSGAAPVKAPKRIPSMSLSAVSVRMLSGLPAAQWAAVFEEGLSDPFTLGELQLWTRDALREWTTTATAERFHVLLIADLQVGTAALLSLSSSTSQRFIMQTLKPEPKVLGLTFFLRRSAEVDIILLDVRSAMAYTDVLLQLPCLIIVAPPDGDFFAAGVRGRSELEGLLEKLMPPIMIGVGNPTLGDALGALPGVARGICRLKTFTGTLGDGAGELRSLLVKGVRLWEAATKETTPDDAHPAGSKPR